LIRVCFPNGQHKWEQERMIEIFRRFALLQMTHDKYKTEGK
jgi:hypothetical protein